MVSVFHPNRLVRSSLFFPSGVLPRIPPCRRGTGRVPPTSRLRTLPGPRRPPERRFRSLPGPLPSPAPGASFLRPRSLQSFEECLLGNPVLEGKILVDIHHGDPLTELLKPFMPF